MSNWWRRWSKEEAASAFERRRRRHVVEVVGPGVGANPLIPLTRKGHNPPSNVQSSFVFPLVTLGLVGRSLVDHTVLLAPLVIREALDCRSVVPQAPRLVCIRGGTSGRGLKVRGQARLERRVRNRVSVAVASAKAAPVNTTPSTNTVTGAPI